MDEILVVFIQEARDQLREMEAGLMQFQSGAAGDTPDPELINAIFRAAHTIKGGAGVVELTVVERFTHSAENLLDEVRNGNLSLSPAIIGDLLAAADHLSALFDGVERGGSGDDAELQVKGEAIVTRLKGHLGEASGTVRATGNSQGNQHLDHKNLEIEESGGGSVSTDTWHISVRFGVDVMRKGMDPMAFLRYLLNLGEIVHITTLFDAMPASGEMDPESCYLGFEINFRSHATKDAIERVFDFVRDDCELFILPPNSKLEDYLRLIDNLPEESLRLGEILVKSGALTQDELEAGLRLQLAQPGGRDGGDMPALGRILIEQHQVQPEIVEAAIVKQKQVTEKKAVEARLIRVHADKLDQLIDLVGELVIAGASTNLVAQRSGQSALVEATSVLTRLVESIRDSALQLRMVQIGETFNRFHRVVRDVSHELGKDIELVISGGETELDKTVVEKIGDPLMHLVRNSIDHGIESAEVRAARGKPAKGRVEMSAYHDSGSIVIEVADDGGGLSRERIEAKALQKGLIQPGQVLSEQEIINLIFEAGFSTVDKVSNLSGRGVGMDVVRKNIQALRGSVDVTTEPGEGSRFTIRLPLTLAIIDGFLIGVGASSYVIPLDMVVECIELQNVTTDRDYLNLRGEVLPFLRLRETFEIQGEHPRRENIVVVQYAGQKAGIVVDQLHGEFQTVIKPLGTLFRNMRGIGGSTILGSGEVALILDVQSLVARCASKEEQHARSSTGSRLLQAH